MPPKSFASLALALLASLPSLLAADLEVLTDFEGGSARVESIDQTARTIQFMPGGDPQRGWPCWWYLRINGIADDETITLNLRGSDLNARNNGQETGKPLNPSWATPMRAAVSTDGKTWQQTEPGKRNGARISYQVTGGGGPVWVAWGPPFTPHDTDDLLAETEKALPSASSFELARTREERPVKALRISEATVASPPAIWVQARQHAWESGASWVLRGFVEWLRGGDPDARWLRQHSELFFVPIMDVDNVATGNGGKESNPHDQNRDWDDAPVYPEVAAAMQRLKTFVKDQRLSVYLDLHNPGATDLNPYFYSVPSDMLQGVALENRDIFFAMAQRHISGPLPLEKEMRFTGPKYHPLWQKIGSQWVRDHGNPQTVAMTLETSWNTPYSNTEGYRKVGQQLGETVTEYLRGRLAK